MTQPIHTGPKGPTGVEASASEAVAGTHETGEAGGPSFEEVMASRARGTEAVAGDHLEVIVDEVVTEMMAGHIGGPAEAFDRVVERLVDRHFANLPSAVRERMSAEVREALTTDPHLFLEVEELLGEALERKMGGEG